MENPFLSPVNFLQNTLGNLPADLPLLDLETWWQKEGMAISASVDGMGTPWLRMFDVWGNRIDEILFPPDYWKMLRLGYRAGAVWRAFESNSLIPSFLIGYLTAFYDAGLYCPYTVSLSTAVPLYKYADETVRQRFLPHLLRQDDQVWQGATWMTEAKGGSDLGMGVECIAEETSAGWCLSGEKYFASNAGAELAVVAARRSDAPLNVRGLSLFLLPRFNQNGALNYFIRRLKDKTATRSVPTGEVELKKSEAYPLGKAEQGIYLILEVLNISRVANSIASVALTQRALAEAYSFAQKRVSFGKPIYEHPLLHHQFQVQERRLRESFALAWEAVQMLNQVWQESYPYSSKYHLFRLVAHLAKYWTAEVAVQTAKWAMEVHGGMGVLAEYGVERWLREAMILPIWEGTPHRQILDGLEVMERKHVHETLFDELSPYAHPQALEETAAQVEALLSLPLPEREAQAEGVFQSLAQFSAKTLYHKLTSTSTANSP
ncbi:MAG: acyl-CoA dehydrogenase family protein [Anaerolineales bacterium]